MIAVLFEGIEPARRSARLRDRLFLLARRGERPRQGGGDEFGFRAPPWATGEVALKIGAPPAELAAVLDSVLGAAERTGVEAPRSRATPGPG